MNPEIQKFWTDQGFTIETDVVLGYADERWRLYWLAVKSTQMNVVGMSDMVAHGHKEELPCRIYIFNDKELSEEQMLKIIQPKLRILL